MKLYRPKIGVGLKTWIAMSILFWIPIGILAGILFFLFGDLLYKENFRSIKTQLKAAKGVYEERVSILEGTLVQLADRGDVQEAVFKGDNKMIKEFFLEFNKNNPYVDILVAVDDKQVVIGRRGDNVGDIYSIGDTLSRALTQGKSTNSAEFVDRDFLTKEEEVYIERFKDNGIVHFVVSPVRYGGKISGAVIAGIFLSGDPWLGNTIYNRFGVEMALFAGVPPDTSFLHATSSLPRNTWVIGQPIIDELKEEISLGKPYYGRLNIADTKHLMAFEPVYNGRNMVIGAIGVSSPATQIDRLVLATLAKGIAVTAAIAFFMAAFITYMVYIDITRPLNFIVRAVEAFGKGDMDISVDVSTGDEFEKLGSGLNSMMDDIRKREDRLKKHSEVAKLLMSTIDLKELLDKMLEIVMGVTESQVGIVYLYEEPNSELVPHIHCGTTASLNRIKIGEGYPGRAAIDNKTYIITSPESFTVEAMDLGFIKAVPKEVAYIPLSYQEKTLGVLVLGSTEKYSDEEVQLFNYLASQISIALDNAIMHQRIQELSITDTLTGLYNRRYLNARLEEEWSRCLRHNMPLSIILCDVDNFKSVNDTYGHDKGDDVLKTIGRTFKSCIRKEDLVSRYGGEEFVAVLVNGTTQDAVKLMERFRQLTKEHVYQWMGRPVTLSIGIVNYPDIKMASYHDMIKAADQAMYQAKVSGKDRVVVSKG